MAKTKCDFSRRKFVVTSLATGLALAVEPVSAAKIETEIELRDVTAETGITFRHDDGHAGSYHIIEFLSAGLATFDYDGDGLIDIYFLNGRPLPGRKSPVPPLRNALYRNLGNWRFV